MPKPKDQKKGGRFGNSPYLKYSGLAVQMGATIVVFTFLGRWLDGQFDTGQILTVVMALIGVFGGMYVALKDFL